MQIGLGCWLIGSGSVRAENHVPRQASVLGHVDQQPGMPIGQRRNDKALLQLSDTGYRIGPRPQLMPCMVQGFQFAASEPRWRQIELRQAGLQILHVDDIERGKGSLSGADRLDGGIILSDPGIRELMGIDMRQLMALEECGDLVRDAAAPIDDSSQHIKNKTSISIPRTGSIASLRIAFQDMQDVNPSPAPGEHCRIDDACRVLPEASIWVIAYARRNRAARRPRRQNSIDADSVKVRGPPSTR